ncbi:hypothetical protein KIPB_017179, partial [Kipferlia bialata]
PIITSDMIDDKTIFDVIVSDMSWDGWSDILVIVEADVSGYTAYHCKENYVDDGRAFSPVFDSCTHLSGVQSDTPVTIADIYGDMRPDIVGVVDSV